MRLLTVVLSCAVISLIPQSSLRADTAVITPLKDNTLFSTTTTSNGSGDAVFSGRTGITGGATVQRAVLAFDVAAQVPAGSEVYNVCLTLLLLQSSPAGGPQTHTLHRILNDWGEGTSAFFGGLGAPATPDDATWLHTFFPDEFWVLPGGDFDPTIRGSAEIAGAALPYTWGSTALMVADVQDWLDNPAANFGWMIRGNEVDICTSKKFASKDHPSVEVRPVLLVSYFPPPVCFGDINSDNAVNGADLALLLGNWGTCGCCIADLTGDGKVDAADLALLLGAWGSC